MNKQSFFYCTNCIVPSTRPSVKFNLNGVCSACTNSKIKNRIDWNKRKFKFLKVLKYHKKLNASNDYDCIVPVSGGKDSIYQTYLLKKYIK